MPNENVQLSDCCQVVYIFIYVCFGLEYAPELKLSN